MLQRTYYKLDALQQDIATIHTGDPMSWQFAEFGAESRIDAPLTSLINPRSIAVGANVHIRSHGAFEALAPPGKVVLRLGDRMHIAHAASYVAVNGREFADDVAVGHGATLADTTHSYKDESH